MANNQLFQSASGKQPPRTDARNQAGAPAYAFDAKHALAQYAATGCLNATFYASAEEQLDTVLRLCDRVPPTFIARTAVYARERGFMKDMPALLVAYLTVQAPLLAASVFERVIDDGRMLRTFVQILRSGVVGRKSLGSMPKRLVKQWLASRSVTALIHASVGNSPSLADVIRMAHPKPTDAERAALYAYLLGRQGAAAAEALPEVLKRYEAYKATRKGPVPDVPFLLLTALDLGATQWALIAEKASWQTTRMNLATFARHGVFDIPGQARRVAARLADPEAIRRARALPYQLLVAHQMTRGQVPPEVTEALCDAMEVAVENVPVFGADDRAAKVYVCADVSGSMHSPVTGHRQGATTAVRCIDVAALVAAAVLRRNKSAEVLAFEHSVVDRLVLSGRDSVMTNAEKLASVGGGGTNCSAPLRRLNDRGARGDLVIFVSDNESWVDARAHGGTEMMRQWSAFRARNPKAKLVCIDIQPNRTTQAADGAEILNVGGFSDAVFEAIAVFTTGTGANHWVDVIERVPL